MPTSLSSCVILGFSLLVHTACATYPDVHSMENGIHYVSFLVSRKGDGNRDAMKQAEAYCSRVQRKNAVLVSETFQYVGTIGEEEYSDVKGEAELKKSHSAVQKALSAKKEQRAGSAVMVDGSNKEQVLGKGYEYTLEFRCD